MENSIHNHPPEIPSDPITEVGNPVSDEKPGFFRFLVDILETLVLSILLFLAINAISARIRVDGSSMEPSLQSGEFVIVNRLAYKVGDPNYGDVVVFHFPGDPGQEYIKRVIGLSGDSVKVVDGTVYINDQPTEEPYIAASPRYQGNWDVPAGHIFVLGDNRNNSSDSHNWGAVPMENVIGEAFFIYWPPPDWGKITATRSANASACWGIDYCSRFSCLDLRYLWSPRV
jgi:signal peptidase I